MKRRVKLLCLLIGRSIGLFALSRLLTRSQLRILCYHGGCIDEESRFNPKLFLNADTLRNRMLWLKKAGFSFVSLDDAVSGEGGSHDKAALRAAVTFDDGWYSTGAQLLPVMTELGIPSTLYLCTKHYIEPWPVLPVVLRYILWKSSRRDVELAGFDTDVDGYHMLETQAQRNRLADRMFESIEKSASDTSTVEAALERFAACLGVPLPKTTFQSRAFGYMNADELRSASLNGCAIELHGHVHQYPVGNPAQFKKDLMICADIIDEIGLPTPKHYCYPSGVSDGDAAAVLRDFGVISATTCSNGLVRESDRAQRYYLPRFVDGENVHILEFQAELSGFYQILRSCIGFFRQNGSIAPEQHAAAQISDPMLDDKDAHIKLIS